jgi:hypothetical protein
MLMLMIWDVNAMLRCSPTMISRGMASSGVLARPGSLVVLLHASDGQSQTTNARHRESEFGRGVDRLPPTSWYRKVVGSVRGWW